MKPEEVMTPEEFAKVMRDIVDKYSYDPEVSHAKGDLLMMNLLKDLGYSEGINIFDEIEKWYA